MHAFTSPRQDPLRQFDDWFAHAKKYLPTGDPTAMVAATVSPKGEPEARWVLLKAFDERGFVFYTNLQSPKGMSLKRHPVTELAFLWDFGKGHQRQVRIQGKTELVSDAEADAYWDSRPRLARLGSFTSRQSQPLASRLQFLKELAKNAARFGTGPVPRPEHWTGVRVIPSRFEFWQGRPNRLHDRFVYRPASAPGLVSRGTGTADASTPASAAGTWKIQRLYP